MIRYSNNQCQLFITSEYLGACSGNAANPTDTKMDTTLYQFNGGDRGFVPNGYNLVWYLLLWGEHQVLYRHAGAHWHVEQGSGSLTEMFTSTFNVLVLCRHFYFRYINHSFAFFPVISRNSLKIYWILWYTGHNPCCLSSIIIFFLKNYLYSNGEL